MKQHGLYKYVYNGEIIYIGKSNSNIDNRIKAHKSERKFRPYLQKAEIYVCDLPNSTETDILEKILINHYKPKLNGTDNFPGLSDSISFNEPSWRPFVPTVRQPNHANAKSFIDAKAAREILEENRNFLRVYSYIMDAYNSSNYSYEKSSFSDDMDIVIDVTKLAKTATFPPVAHIRLNKGWSHKGLHGQFENFYTADERIEKVLYKVLPEYMMCSGEEIKQIKETIQLYSGCV